MKKWSVRAAAAAVFLLADEPTGNLDSKSGEEIMAILMDLWKGGRTIVMVTHNDHIAARSQRIIRLLDGNVVP
jgi:putative ABC transport system ATP-binding protein